MKKILIVIAVIFIIFCIGFIINSVFFSKYNAPADSIACTMEAKVCPDGSAVGRSGPNCEFAECPVQIANPASVNCKEKGGTSEIITAADGSQSGICKFPDGTKCEEWEFMRGDCVPGVKQDEIQDLGIVTFGKQTGNLKKYIFNSLGVSFTVFTSKGEKEIAVQKIGQKIFVGGQSGQSVEVFAKDQNQTLKQAIEQKFLANYSNADCFVIDYNRTNNSPANLVSEIISYPKPTDPNAPWFANMEKCPKNYSQTNGIRYFLEDVNHPSMFVFFSIGQYGIPGNANDVMWQDTLQFLK